MADNPYDFKALIEAHVDTRNLLIADNDAYKQVGLAIQSRTLPADFKINNKLPNDFRGEIVNQINGYLFGKPVTYSLDKTAYGENSTAFDKDSAEFQDFLKLNDIDDLDAETHKRGAVMGVTYRLCYTDDDAKARIDNLNPWQVIYIDEHAAILYAKDGVTNLHTVQVYDDTNVSTYVEVSSGEYQEDPDNPPIPHNFQLMPVIRFQNNDEELPEFRKVEALIDAYDRTVSDAQNEIEEWRQAYLKLIGMDAPTAEEAAQLRATGTIAVDVGGDVGFVTKDINDTFLEHHKQTLRENIYRHSGTVDMTDQKFSGADQSGEARKWKLLPLDNKAAIAERKFRKGLKQMFKVLETYWSALGFDILADNITYTFDRNIPMELKMESEITTNLKGMVSERTRLENLSIVTDVEAEIEAMDAEATVDLDKIPDVEPKEE
jgi:SPP1 family phage portal protein